MKTGKDTENSTADPEYENEISGDKGKRVPAEWETHAATWMQWPKQWESKLQPAFAEIINIVQEYELVHLLTSSEAEKAEAKGFLSMHGVPNTNITWHIIPVDNAWMRDNGPVYVTDGTETWIQNWNFDAWGGNFGHRICYENDNLVPVQVANYLGITSKDYQDYVLERGNLEFNGAGTLVLNWDCQDDRNPGMTKSEHEAILMEAFGVTQIIWAHGHRPEDRTIGHIDGRARFIDSQTIVIADYGEHTLGTYKSLAGACEEAGFELIWYPGAPNWLVGNGFVLTANLDDHAADAKAKSILKSMFSSRDVHLLDVKTIWKAGGGIHCVTNDEPLIV